MKKNIATYGFFIALLGFSLLSFSQQAYAQCVDANGNSTGGTCDNALPVPPIPPATPPPATPTNTSDGSTPGACAKIVNGSCQSNTPAATPATPATPAVTPSTGTQNSFVGTNGNLTYTPLEPLPIANGFQNGTANVPALLNGILKILVIGGALLAVGMFVFGGIQYMVSDVIKVKFNAKGRAKSAVWGLLLLLGAYIILNTINPQLLNFSSIFCPTTGIAGGGCSNTATSPINNVTSSAIPAAGTVNQQINSCPNGIVSGSGQCQTIQ